MSFTPLENVAVENCVGKRKIKLNFSAQKKEKKKAIKCAIAMKKVQLSTEHKKLCCLQFAVVAAAAAVVRLQNIEFNLKRKRRS